jgi:hypothetical protein
MKLASFPVNTRREFLFRQGVAISGPKKSHVKNVALSSNREASNRVEKCHSENPNEWITFIVVNDNPYQMVNAANSTPKKCVCSGLAGLFFGNFGAQAVDFRVQSLNPLFQFGYRDRIKVFSDNHVGRFFWGVVDVHGGCPCIWAILALRSRVRQPIVPAWEDFET